jgi:hypothetical protein
MNDITQLFVEHLKQSEASTAALTNWLDGLGDESEDQERVTIHYMSALAKELQEFVKGVDLAAAANAFSGETQLVA